jgi:hypothetical protein
MSGTPSDQNPVPDDPRSIDLPAEGASTAGSVEESHSSPRHAAKVRRLRDRPLRKKILTPVILAVIGVALFILGIGLYHTESEVPPPQYSTLGLITTFPVNDVIYAVGQESPSIDVVTVEVDLPGGAALPSAKTGTAHLLMTLPSGITFKTCPKAVPNTPPYSTPVCLERQNIYTWVQPLAFKMIQSPFEPVGTAFASFLVETHSFGETFDGRTASVAIPAVNYQGPGTFVLETKYDLPSASSYNWSSFPTQFATDTYAQWNEPVTGSVVSGRVAVGTNYAAQAKDDSETFFAGALIGLAGAALLFAVQEALHAND